MTALLQPRSALPSFQRVLAVGAHPDDESFGLGAILSSLVGQGVQVWALSFTHGEASTLGGPRALRELRALELTGAAVALDLVGVRLLDYPDGQLARVPRERLADDVHSFASDIEADALVVFDTGGITGHPDHCHATEAASLAARRLDLPVLAWAIPEEVANDLNREFGTKFVGRSASEADFTLMVDRSRQTAAIARHGSQSGDNPVLWRRLQLLGDTEWLRYLRPVKKGKRLP